MNIITQLQEQIEALQEQLLLLTKEVDAKGASEKSLLSRDGEVGEIAHYFVVNGFDGFFPDSGLSYNPDDPTVFKEPYADDYAKAFNTFFALRHCEGSEPAKDVVPQYIIVLGDSIVDSLCICEYLSILTKIERATVCFDTEENANKAIETVGEENILHMMKTFAGVFQSDRF